MVFTRTFKTAFRSVRRVSGFATTFGGGFADPRFVQRARQIAIPPELDHLPRRRFRITDEVVLFGRVLWAAVRETNLLLFSSRGRLKPELLAIACIALWPRRFRPNIVLYGEMYEPNDGARGRLERRLLRIADRAIVRYIVYSVAECHIFPNVWGIDPAKMRACLFYMERQPQVSPEVRPSAGHIFAGGNSFRDYTPLLEAARQLPERQFVIGTKTIPADVDVPPNVKAGPIAPADYIRLIETAAAVVVPLQRHVRRITGVLTYFEAMWHRKPPIVSDAVGVREYVQDGKTGWVVDGSPDGYVAAIRWICDPAHADHVRRMGEDAHAALQEQFTLAQHVTQMLAVMDEVAGGAPAAQFRSI